MTVGWSTRLAKRMLFQSARDMTPERGASWLGTPTCQSLCAQAKVDYGEFTKAMLYLLGKSALQRAILLQNLKKHIGA